MTEPHMNKEHLRKFRGEKNNNILQVTYFSPQQISDRNFTSIWAWTASWDIFTA